MSEAREVKSVDCIKQEERAWHDAYYNTYALSVFPNTPEEFRQVFTRSHLSPFCEGGCGWWGDARQEALDVVGDVRGLRVLDYGCGYGWLGIYLSQCGAQVRGFDFSDPAIETANLAAQRYRLAAQFEQMDAEDLSYPDGSFDLVVGFGVLHHVVKYPRASSHLFRVLRPGGQAVYHETLWDNPFINLARRFTSVDSAAGDSHLTERSLREFCRDFSQVRLEKRHLLYMAKRLAKLPATDWNAPLQPRPFWRAIKALDNRILRFQPLRRYCGEVIVWLQK